MLVESAMYLFNSIHCIHLPKETDYKMPPISVTSPSKNKPPTTNHKRNGRKTTKTKHHTTPKDGKRCESEI
jgi:hypothetical protein